MATHDSTFSPAETGLVTKLRHWAQEAEHQSDKHLTLSAADFAAILRTARSALDEARTAGKVEACEEVLEIGRQLEPAHDFENYVSIIDAELKRHKEQLDS